MDIPIHFNDQLSLVTVKIDSKPCNDLLPPKVDAQPVRPQFFPIGLQPLTSKRIRANISVIDILPTDILAHLHESIKS